MNHIALGMVWIASLTMQDPSATSIEAAFRHLLEDLETYARDGAPPNRVQRVVSLQNFIKEFSGPDKQASALELLQARTRLASLHLGSFDLELANQQFLLVLEQTATDDKDLRPRALYGLAQVQELSGQAKAAKRTLRRIIRSYEGTRYATYARIALQRIEAKAIAAIGKLAPPIRPHLDLTDKAKDLASLHGKPVLILFWSPDHPEGLDQIDRLLAAASTAGLEQRQILSFGLHSDTDQLRIAAQQRNWDGSIIPLSHEFLDPLVVMYGLRSLPSNFLVGPDGTLLARNSSPARLATALRNLIK